MTKHFWQALVFSLMPASALSDDIEIVAPHITGLIEEGGQGYYQQLLSMAAEPEHLSADSEALKYQEQFLPYKRALMTFKKGGGDCIYSFTKVLTEEFGSEQIIFSYPFGAFAYYVFTRADQPPLASVSALSNQQVGGTLGHDAYYRRFLPDDVKLELVNDDAASVRKLQLGRVDYIIGALPDLNPYLDELSYDPTSPLVKSYDRLTCRNTVKAAQFLNTLSRRLISLKNNGVYRDIGGPLYIEFEQDFVSY